jgi:feruloyl esterase
MKKHVPWPEASKRTITMLAGVIIASGMTAGCVPDRPAVRSQASVAMVEMCTAERLQTVASTLAAGVTVRQIEEDPKFDGGVRFVPASGDVPAYCQVTGSFLTNPKTGKTANFLATLPENWNGKYLQLGCSGHCGTFGVSNPATPMITISNQGMPGDIIRKGYAAFATDEGHTETTGGSWAVKGPGQLNEDFLTDYLYRSQEVLARVGKEFTRSFYALRGAARPSIKRSYFSGCSGGGRDALVAASYFPEEFDGIIAGSPYNLAGRAFHGAATSLAAYRSPSAALTPELHALLDRTVKAQCDALDGVKDGLIQNPAACNFLPERDLPKCEGASAGNQCFSKAQIETLSVALSAVTDENGNLIQPGFAVSELTPGFAPPTPPKAELATMWPDTNQPGYVIWSVANATIKLFGHKNDPTFQTRSIVTYREGGPGAIGGFHAVVPRAEVALVTGAVRRGIGHFPENADNLIRQNRKLMIWHNFSDQALTPYMSVNYYNALAKRHGGYRKLQDNVRLFALPGTPHCSGGGLPAGPGSFDALSAMESWVERGQAPDGLLATSYQPRSYDVDFSKPLGQTMPLCKFPEMARYKGTGNVNDAKNWHCPEGDTAMLKVGESGRRAGVIP